MYNLQKICRICLAEKDEDNSDLFKMLTLNIKINEVDGLPHIICNICKSEVEKAIKFAENFKKNDQILKSQFTTSTSLKADEIKEDSGLCSDHFEIADDVSSEQEESKSDTGKLNCKYEKQHYICAICDKGFGYPSLLEQHIRCHTGYKPHTCLDCGKCFTQSGALNFHRKIHSGEKRFNCDFCNEKFISHGVLRVHTRKHTKEKPYICRECGIGFRQVSDLRGHSRTHTGERSVLCSLCGKKYSTIGILNIHMRTHTGEKPFKCEFCYKAFTTRSLLMKHNRIHTGERPYVCHICGRSFTQSNALKKHFETHQIDRTKGLKMKAQKNVIETKYIDEVTLEDVGGPKSN
ncbi:hypothetical protein HHI36_005782 [Cryptolaemus montrouzieri]|uniref:Uncharacterized protein n=1 Tax=Cryptolaemus montrouzieri TaxID=559131 RepID=A0ABD2NV58_9CUCU